MFPEHWYPLGYQRGGSTGSRWGHDSASAIRLIIIIELEPVLNGPRLCDTPHSKAGSALDNNCIFRDGRYRSDIAVSAAVRPR
ncbi:hypothetical protein EVAR_103746_1 [Eumeta japonica]|uniref:Uncharacterized protein n=1 Tax=Eumeta variegata TaxID=151549 RepID=A0A4C1ZMC4_EUMVA|nr:hypothetical protein EVAR_103746_1 [Eumeta japonica]